MIKVIITVETDGDFKLGLPKIVPGYYNLEYNGDYKLELSFNEKNATSDLLAFLKEIEIISSKDWHKDELKEGIEKYVSHLNKYGISSASLDLLGGGNWSFVIAVSKITEEVL